MKAISLNPLERVMGIQIAAKAAAKAAATTVSIPSNGSWVFRSMTDPTIMKGKKESQSPRTGHGYSDSGVFSSLRDRGLQRRFGQRRVF